MGAVSATAVMSSDGRWRTRPCRFPDMSLEDLVNTEITSASCKSQNQQHVAAAVSSSPRRTSPAPAPAIWPTSRRWHPVSRWPGWQQALGGFRPGFNGRFANKLQVPQDGRSVYSPLFSRWPGRPRTWRWDIERIEIIRGPNAVAWGSMRSMGPSTSSPARRATRRAV